MKILYITNGAGYSGSTIALENIITYLRDRIECQVVFPRKKGAFSDRLDEMGVRYHNIRYTMNIYPNKNLQFCMRAIKLLYTYIANFIAVIKIKRIAEVFQPDIIHSNTGSIDLGYKVAKDMNIPHVWHLREYLDKDFGFLMKPNWEAHVNTYHHPNNHCIAITNGVYHHFKLVGDAKVIYDGVISGGERKVSKNEDYFLFAGRLIEAKGYLSLLKAYTIYVHEGGKTSLWFAGEVENDSEIKANKIIKENGLGDMVKLLGFRSDVTDLMSRAKALFVPSRFEGFGFITTEAMYNHCLVVGRNTAGTKEQFDNGLKLQGKEIGIRFIEDEQLPSIMWDIENNDYTEMKEAAYDTVCKMYTIRKNADSIYDYYLEILKKK